MRGLGFKGFSVHRVNVAQKSSHAAGVRVLGLGFMGHRV